MTARLLPLLLVLTGLGPFTCTKSKTVESEQWKCSADADCENTCAHGAVNKGWYAKTYPEGEGCQDGCASKGMGAPRCEQSVCTAYGRDGKREDYCTRKP